MRWPPSQLSSMKRRPRVWSVTVLSTKFSRDQEIYERKVARTVAAAALRMWIAESMPGSAYCSPQAPGPVRASARLVGLIRDGAHMVVIPAVGVVVQDHDRGVVPIRRLLQEVDHVDDERLLVEWIGVSGVTVLISGRFRKLTAGKLLIAASTSSRAESSFGVCR